MNRHERRAKRKQERKARKAERPMPPGYIACVQKIDRLIPEWLRAQETTPDLKWHNWEDAPKGERIAFAGSLADPLAVGFLANSPDAFRLCAWLAEQTEQDGGGTLIQLEFVLRKRGVFEKREEKSTSRAMRSLTDFAHDTGTTTRIDPSPCGHCGVILECASGEKGHVPTPGMISVCIECFGFNLFDDQLHHKALSEDEFAALPEEAQQEAAQLRDLFRAARLQGREKNVYKKAAVFA